MRFTIGLDLGTSAAKGILLSEKGELIIEKKTPTEYIRKNDGEVTFNGNKFYTKLASLIKELVSYLPPDGEIVGISASSASGNTMLLDKDGDPICDAFSWLDTRTHKNCECEKIFGEIDPEKVRDMCGWLYLNQFPIAHLSWLKENREDLLEKADKICMSTDFINYKLCGKYAIDSSTATSFYLIDQKANKWNKEMLDKLGIQEEKLPKIMPTGTTIGYVSEKASKETGLPTSCAVVLGAFDHPTAARGTEITKEGQLLLSCGTSWVCFVPINDRKKIIDLQLLCDSFLSFDGGPWAGMFSLASISSLIHTYINKWITTSGDQYKIFDELARKAKPGAGGLIINPMTDINRDLSYYSKENICRALQEGTAYLLAKAIKDINEAGIKITSATMVGGPSKTNPWPQIVTDMLGIDVNTIYGVSAGAVGAATIAAISTGVYSSLENAYATRIPDKIERHPNPEIHNLYKKQFDL